MVTIFSIIVNKIFVYGLTVNLNGFHCLEHERNKRFIEGECRIWTNIIKKEVFIRNKNRIS